LAGATITELDPADGLPVMEVGRWVTEEKHQIIKRYIDASWAARRRFSSQRTYVDLFAGTGRVKVKHTTVFVDGGPMAAWNMARQQQGTFSDFFIADANADFLAACESRLRNSGTPVISKIGRADETIDWVLPQLQQHGLHLALLDPFNAGHLHFSIIEKLATLRSIDIVVHLSTGDIQRNIAAGLNSDTSSLDAFAPAWRQVVRKQSSKQDMRRSFIDHWKQLVRATGLRVCDTMYPVRNSKDSTMYWLCLLTRHDLAEKLWRESCYLRNKALF
jgi:three-Cys-motif partner protein